jgi:peptide-methionine (S)-S-oxide reductase
MRMMMRAATVVGFLSMGASPLAATTPAKPPVKNETIVFAGGCFWGVESVFDHTKGVLSAVSGYAGGSVDGPSYEQVSSGRTGHAESVKVTFDPSQVSLEQLLRIFFTVAHDPTQLNRQGPDVGTQYRSMIDYSTDDQKREVKAFIDQLAQSHAYGGRPIVTEVVPYKTFFPAENYHQHFAEHNPTNPYIAMWDAPKVENLKKQFPQFYRDVK